MRQNYMQDQFSSDPVYKIDDQAKGTRISHESAREKRERTRRVNYNPPRSMTPEEKEYYDKHKNLNGFYR